MKTSFSVSLWSTISTKIPGRSRADADLILPKEQWAAGKVEMNQGWKYRCLLRCLWSSAQLKGCVEAGFSKASRLDVVREATRRQHCIVGGVRRGADIGKSHLR